MRLITPQSLAKGDDVELGRVATADGRGLVVVRRPNGQIVVLTVLLRRGQVCKIMCGLPVSPDQLNELADMIDEVATDVEGEQAKT